jgi:hypothetical protein
MFGFLYLIVTRHKLTVRAGQSYVRFGNGLSKSVTHKDTPHNTRGRWEKPEHRFTTKARSMFYLCYTSDGSFQQHIFMKV